MGRAIYGYMRALPDTSAEDVERTEQQLFAWADAHGHPLAVVYQESGEQSTSALDALVRELELTGQRTVVVPSREHVGPDRALRALDGYEVRTAEGVTPGAGADERPVIHGHIRLHNHESDEAVRHAERTLRGYAEATGYALVLAHYEVAPGVGLPLRELAGELRKAQVGAVLVSDVDRLAASPEQRRNLFDGITRAADGAVIELDGEQ